MTVTLTDLLQLHTSHLFDIDSDGRLLVGTDASGCTQLAEIDPDAVAGDRAPDSTVITDFGEPVTGRYLPGERRVVVSVDDGGTERKQLWLVDAAHPDTPAVPLVLDPRYIHELLEVAPDTVVYQTNRRNAQDFDIVARTVSTGEERVLYDGGGWPSEVAISPDQRWIAFTRLTAVAASSEVMLIDVTEGTQLSVTDASESGDWSGLRWLADSSVLLASSDAPVPGLASDRVSVRALDPVTREWRVVIADESADLAAWPSPGGSHLAVVRTADGADQVSVHELGPQLSVGEPRTVALPGTGKAAFRSPLFFTADSTALGFTFTCPVRPAEVYLWREAAPTEVCRATWSNPSAGVGATSGIQGLVDAELHHAPAPDGEQVPVLVLRPEHADGSAVLIIHGGPESASERSWNAVAAGLALAGHTVVLPNVRGSSGYGRRWLGMDDVGLRLASVEDLRAVHDWLPTLGVDAGRAALYGGSYGGYMVLAGLTFQPELWAAGVDIVGMSSLVTFLQNTSAYRRAYREREYGSLALHRDLLEAASPLNRISELRAPLFIIHGANDPRVPLSEAEQVAAAVRANGAECELLVYADEGHGLAKRVNRLDAYPQAADFLARHLRIR